MRRATLAAARRPRGLAAGLAGPGPCGWSRPQAARRGCPGYGPAGGVAAAGLPRGALPRGVGGAVDRGARLFSAGAADWAEHGIRTIRMPKLSPSMAGARRALPAGLLREPPPRAAALLALAAWSPDSRASWLRTVQMRRLPGGS